MEMESILTKTKEPLSKIGDGLASQKSTLGRPDKVSDLWIAERFESAVKLVTDNERTEREMLGNAKAHATFWFRQIRLRNVEKNPGPVEKQPEISDQQRAIAVVEVLVEFLECTGFVREKFKTAGDVKQWTEWFRDSGDWMKFTKYKIAAFYQYAQRTLLLDQTLPPSPLKTLQSHPLHLLGGRAGRYLRRRIRLSNPTRQEFLSSLLLVKGGMPLPPDSALKAKKKETEKVLTTPRIRSWRSQPVLIPGLANFRRRHGITSFAQLVDGVSRVTRKLFQRERFGTKDILANPITPSFSANYVNNKEGHGTFGHLLERSLFGILPRRPLRSYTQPVEEYIGLDNDVELVLEGFDGARDQFLHTYFSSVRAAMDEPPIAKAVPLAEALKVRVITKGPPLTMYVLQPVQQFMWKVLKKHPAFKLIGEPVSEGEVFNQIGTLLDREGFLSGDYSDATNQLDPELSAAAWNTLCDVCAIPRALKELGLRVLTNHWIVTGKDRDTGEDRVMPQQWGQLMGSIISFPILCIVNAAVCLMSMEYDQDCALDLDKIPLMINGDDCLLRVGPEGYSAWNVFGTMAGLSPSVGKVYYSREFCNINSTTFVPVKRTVAVTLNAYGLDDEVMSFHRVKVLRLGLVFGNKRSQAKVDQEKIPALELAGGDMTIGSRHKAMIAECPDAWKLRAHLKFLAKNWKALKFATDMQLPWYVPTCYGGVGLQPLPDLGSFDMTEKDKKIITAMTNESAWNRPSWNKDEGRFEGTPARMPRKPAPATEIAVHLAALKELRHHTGDVPTRWVTETAFDRDGLDSPALNWWVLYQRPEAVLVTDLDMSMKTCLHNQRTWNWYFKHYEKFAWMGISDVRPRRLVHQVSVVERRPSVLPNRFEIQEAMDRNETIELVSGREALFGSLERVGQTRQDSLSRNYLALGSVSFDV